MEWIDTPDSSTIVRFCYDEDAKTTEVEFNKSSTYQFFDVPAPAFEQMKNAAPKGQYFAQNINDVFRYARS